MKRSTASILPCLLFVFCLSFPHSARGEITVAGLDTNGITFQVDPKTGTLTEKVEEPFTAFVLGATTRKAGTFYYIAQPSGEPENAIFTVTLKTGAISHVDLDRSEGARALFIKGGKLYGVFYDGGGGTAGVYRIAPGTGVTTLVLDLSALDVEPIAGAFTEFQGNYYMLVRPESDSGQRKLLRFKTRAGSAKLFDVVDGNGSPVLCDKLKPNAGRGNFVCLAQAASETQVDFCRMSLKGKTTCLNTLPGIERVGNGHTMLTKDHKTYYAFVYVPGEPNNQRLIKLNAKGEVKANLVLDTIMIGGHFKSEAAQ